MDKRAVTAAALLFVIAGLVLGLVVGVLAGKDGDTGSKPPNTITVQGTASASSAPDLAILRVGFRIEGATAEEVFAAGADRANAVRAALEAAGVAEADIQTQDLRLSKRTENRGDPDERTYSQAEQDFEVKIRDVNDAGGVASAAVEAGANTVGGIEFEITDKAPSREEALTEAIQGARSKAEAMAAAAGAEVGDVILIDETNTDYLTDRQPLSYGYLQSADSFNAAARIISPGEVETRVTVMVIYELDA